MMQNVQNVGNQLRKVWMEGVPGRVAGKGAGMIWGSRRRTEVSILSQKF